MSQTFLEDIPEFLEIQRNSFLRILKTGLIESLEKINPISITSGAEYGLLFYPQDYVVVLPDITITEAFLQGKTYGCKIYVPALVYETKKNEGFYEERQKPTKVAQNASNFSNHFSSIDKSKNLFLKKEGSKTKNSFKPINHKISTKLRTFEHDKTHSLKIKTALKLLRSVVPQGSLSGPRAQSRGLGLLPTTEGPIVVPRRAPQGQEGASRGKTLGPRQRYASKEQTTLGAIPKASVEGEQPKPFISGTKNFLSQKYTKITQGLSLTKKTNRVLSLDLRSCLALGSLTHLEHLGPVALSPMGQKGTSPLTHEQQKALTHLGQRPHPLEQGPKANPPYLIDESPKGQKFTLWVKKALTIRTGGWVTRKRFLAHESQKSLSLSVSPQPFRVINLLRSSPKGVTTGVNHWTGPFGPHEPSAVLRSTSLVHSAKKRSFSVEASLGDGPIESLTRIPERQKRKLKKSTWSFYDIVKDHSELINSKVLTTSVEIQSNTTDLGSLRIIPGVLPPDQSRVRPSTKDKKPQAHSGQAFKAKGHLALNLEKAPNRTISQRIFRTTALAPYKLKGHQSSSLKGLESSPTGSSTHTRWAYNTLSQERPTSTMNFQFSPTERRFREQPKSIHRISAGQGQGVQSTPRGLKAKEVPLSKKEWVCIGILPLMTPRGHFIINGSHRIIVSQMARAPGLYYQTGEKVQATIVPSKGAWLRISLKLTENGEKKLWVRITPQRKMPYKIFLDTYKYLESKSPDSQFKFLNLTYKNINSKIKHFDKHYSIGVISGQINRTLLNSSSYTLGKLGRKRLNERLGTNEKAGYITSKDISFIKESLIKLLNHNSTELLDDIDNLANRRVRTCGELLQSEIEDGILRLKKVIAKQLEECINPNSFSVKGFSSTPAALTKRQNVQKNQEKNISTALGDNHEEISQNRRVKVPGSLLKGVRVLWRQQSKPKGQKGFGFRSKSLGHRPIPEAKAFGHRPLVWADSPNAKSPRAPSGLLTQEVVDRRSKPSALAQDQGLRLRDSNPHWQIPKALTCFAQRWAWAEGPFPRVIGVENRKKVLRQGLKPSSAIATKHGPAHRVLRSTSSALGLRPTAWPSGPNAHLEQGPPHFLAQSPAASSWSSGRWDLNPSGVSRRLLLLRQQIEPLALSISSPIVGSSTSTIKPLFASHRSEPYRFIEKGPEATDPSEKGVLEDLTEQAREVNHCWTLTQPLSLFPRPFGQRHCPSNLALGFVPQPPDTLEEYPLGLRIKTHNSYLQKNLICLSKFISKNRRWYQKVGFNLTLATNLKYENFQNFRILSKFNLVPFGWQAKGASNNNRAKNFETSGTGRSSDFIFKNSSFQYIKESTCNKNFFDPKWSPSKIVGTKAFASALREFFGSNPLSQYMDQTNPLAEITHKRRLSSLGPGGVDRSSAGIAIRGIHSSHYGKICPIETPEGKNAGLVNSMTMWTRVNDEGFLQTPYLKVQGGSIMSHANNLAPQWHFVNTKIESYGKNKRRLTPLEIEFLNQPLQIVKARGPKVQAFGLGFDDRSKPYPKALPPFAPKGLKGAGSSVQTFKKSMKIVASDLNISESSFLPNIMLPTRDGSERSFSRQKRETINFCGVSPMQNISVATSLIPFLEHDDATRALMGSNMQRQAVPLLKPQGPLVRTGLEGKVVGESGHALQALCSGIISTATKSYISIDTFNINIESKSSIIGNFALNTKKSVSTQKIGIDNLQFNFSVCFLQKTLTRNQFVSRKYLPCLGPSSPLWSLGGCESKENWYQETPSFVEGTCALAVNPSRGKKRYFKLLNKVLFISKNNKTKEKEHDFPPFTSQQMVPSLQKQLSFFTFEFKNKIWRKTPKVSRNRQYQTLQQYTRSNQATVCVQRPAVDEGHWVQKGDLVGDCSASQNGVLALGQNIVVAYLPMEGFNFEDAIVVSDRLVHEQLYTSIHIQRVEFDLDAVVKKHIGLKIKVKKQKSALKTIHQDWITIHNPHLLNSEKKALNSLGIIKVGSWVGPGDVLVSKVIPVERKIAPSRHLLYAVFQEKKTKTLDTDDTSLRVPKNIHGRVINVKIVGSGTIRSTKLSKEYLDSLSDNRTSNNDNKNTKNPNLQVLPNGPIHTRGGVLKAQVPQVGQRANSKVNNLLLPDQRPLSVLRAYYPAPSGQEEVLQSTPNSSLPRFAPMVPGLWRASQNPNRLLRSRDLKSFVFLPQPVDRRSKPSEWTWGLNRKPCLYGPTSGPSPPTDLTLKPLVLPQEGWAFGLQQDLRSKIPGPSLWIGRGVWVEGRATGGPSSQEHQPVQVLDASQKPQENALGRRLGPKVLPCHTPQGQEGAKRGYPEDLKAKGSWLKALEDPRALSQGLGVSSEGRFWFSGQNSDRHEKNPRLDSPALLFAKTDVYSIPHPLSNSSEKLNSKPVQNLKTNFEESRKLWVYRPSASRKLKISGQYGLFKSSVYSPVGQRANCGSKVYFKGAKFPSIQFGQRPVPSWRLCRAVTLWGTKGQEGFGLRPKSLGQRPIPEAKASGLRSSAWAAGLPAMQVEGPKADGSRTTLNLVGSKAQSKDFGLRPTYSDGLTTLGDSSYLRPLNHKAWARAWVTSRISFLTPEYGNASPALTSGLWFFGKSQQGLGQSRFLLNATKSTTKSDTEEPISRFKQKQSLSTYNNSKKPVTSKDTILEKQKIDQYKIIQIRVYIAERKNLQVGDKMSGRHGNKGIVSTILPREDMPYLPDGTCVDMVLNPLGIPSRMNVGQVFECLLGLAASVCGETIGHTPFDEMYGPEASRSLVYLFLYVARLRARKDWLFQPNFPGKTVLFDGRTGTPFEQWVTVGRAYMLKLIHMVDEKIHARSIGPRSLVTQQPVKGRARGGGQRLGEMELWAFEGFGAAYTLQEILTLKSDDIKGREKVENSIIFARTAPAHIPETFRMMLFELRCLCLNVELNQNF